MNKLGVKIGSIVSDARIMLYMVSCIDVNKICLISLSTGNRWREPVRVDSVFNISDNELFAAHGPSMNITHEYESIEDMMKGKKYIPPEPCKRIVYKMDIECVTIDRYTKEQFLKNNPTLTFVRFADD